MFIVMGLVACPVCGDVANGYHYGIYTCESCKTFFKRSVMQHKTYNCVRDSICSIKINTRKKCPSCRFEKCKRVGMLTQLVRMSGERGGKHSSLSRIGGAPRYTP
ncbi:nuclear receptor subfamily 5 group A member 2-like [Leguminivora glycinivorella]|uniref:nuclear receptor subfamily 5 group A member 2-like n=1 Tax=Leguminivora glycinivorella TaxID=1035111 RepID=UPI00200DEA95|nr:nuclear receptor subfamily 5 group A member 2-like [Leguminivora glycinivorella]